MMAPQTKSLEDLKREAEGYGNIIEAVSQRAQGYNPRAEHIARCVEGLGNDWLNSEFLEENDWLCSDYRQKLEDIRSLFNWLYLRLIGQDKTLPVRDAWVLHKDQRGAVPLHPIAVTPWQVESHFIDPVTGYKCAVTVRWIDGGGA